MTELQLRTQEIAAIQLTPEEEKEAIRIAKATKWHRERNTGKWNDSDEQDGDNCG